MADKERKRDDEQKNIRLSRDDEKKKDVTASNKDKPRKDGPKTTNSGGPQMKNKDDCDDED